MTVDLLGDAAIVVTFAADVSASANDRVHALAASLREQPIAPAAPAIEIVPAMVSLTLHVPPGEAARLLPLVRARAGALPAAVARVEGRVHEIPVAYGGAGGPDLADVSARAGLAPGDVARRHAAGLYRVYMLGFLPGFAYLGDVEAAIAAPRRATPRAAVPAGSVGIAGTQTGVYPRESPGGWQIVGRTSLPMFDAAAGARLQAGDRVRFVIEDIA